MASKTFDTPFCDIGDKTAVPDPAQPSGSVSFEEGYTSDYELDQTGGPPAKDVERQEMNQLFFDITEFLQEVQRNGLPVYDATYDYEVGGYTLGSDGIFYRALIANGPASSVVDPVGDTTSTWLSNRGDTRDYEATFDFVPDDIVKGSDGILYVALLDNGPSSSVVDPVGDTTGKWTTVKTDVSDYLATFDYALRDYAKGADGGLYRAAIVNGPSTSVVNPVGDATGTWLIVGGGPTAMIQTVVTADDPAWIPNPQTRTIKVVVTGGGGGGGGANGGGGGGGESAAGGAGGAGATGIKTFSSPFDASYAIVVGAGGTGGLNADDGVTGGTSSFNGASIAIVSATGGVGGEGSSANTGPGWWDGGAGGAASGGDVDLAGGGGGSSSRINGDNAQIGVGGSSFWGGGATNVNDSSGDDADTYGAGASGGANQDDTNDRDGGLGGDGVVVIEEYL